MQSKREIKKIPSSTYMYSRLRIPGVLIECGFLSNPNERKNLLNEEYLEKLCQILADSLKTSWLMGGGLKLYNYHIVWW